MRRNKTVDETEVAHSGVFSFGSHGYRLRVPLHAPNYLWQKRATHEWLQQHEQRLREATEGGLAVIEMPNRKRLLVEAPCSGLAAARELLREFGGTVENLPRDWLTRFLPVKASKPIRIGERLVVMNVGGASARSESPRQGGSHIVAAHTLLIPAGAAFGTGEHATTAMSLRILERHSRRRRAGWRMLDAGTGSGILALAARRFGAGKIVAIDIDPTAIATARKNARANGTRGVRFIVGDVRRHVSGEFDIIAANLYSELLAEMLPAFSGGLSPFGRIILTGVLRQQEQELAQKLRANRFVILETKRRGKWIALLAKSAGPKRRRRAARGEKRG